MKAIELKAKTDADGLLKIDYPMGASDQEVRVLILVDDEVISNEQQEESWLNDIFNNPSFDFLNDPAEDIYTIDDGKPLDD